MSHALVDAPESDKQAIFALARASGAVGGGAARTIRPERGGSFWHARGRLSRTMDGRPAALAEAGLLPQGDAPSPAAVSRSPRAITVAHP